MDLSKTAYMGSAFIEVVFRAWKRVTSCARAKLVLCGVQPLCAEVLRTTRLDSVGPKLCRCRSGVAGRANCLKLPLSVVRNKKPNAGGVRS